MPPAFCKVKEGCVGGGVHACVLSHDAADLFFLTMSCSPVWKSGNTLQLYARC